MLTVKTKPITNLQEVYSSKRCYPKQRTVTKRLEDKVWSNWHGNLSYNVKTGKPTSLPELVELIRYGESHNLKIGVTGSSWSYTGCAVSQHDTLLIDTSDLNKDITHKLKDVTSEEIYKKFRRQEWILVEAGMKIHELNCLASSFINSENKPNPKELPTLGGSRGQSIAGAMSTSTHGGDIRMGPIANYVLAIHLVGPTGKEFWIEPSTALGRIIDQEKMEAKKNGVDFCSGLEVIYDDHIFRTCLTSLGCAGVIYSVVLQLWSESYSKKETIDRNWSETQSFISTIVDHKSKNDFVEIVINPASKNCKITTYNATTEIPAPTKNPTVAGGLSGGSDDKMRNIMMGLLLGPGALGVLTASMTKFLGDKMLEFGALQAIPIFGQIRSIDLMKETIKPFEDMFNTFKLLVEAPQGDEKKQAELAITLINLIWRIGLFVDNGRHIIDQIQEQFVSSMRRVGTDVRKTYQIKTGQPDCSHDGAQNHSAFEKLVESYEYVVSAEKGIDFINRIQQIIDECRRSSDAFVGSLSVRFSTQSLAYLGIQQHEHNCHVEIFTFKGLRGNSLFQQKLYGLVKQYNAIPHWGQYHDETTNFHALYGEKLTLWQNAIKLISNKSGDKKNAFWSAFALNRGLL